MSPSIALPFKALIDPVGAMPRVVEARKWFIPLLILAVLTAASGALLSRRIDMSRVVIPKMQMSGELSKASEREITEEIEQSERLALVLSVATGAFAVPALALLMAAGLKVLAWLFGRKSLFIETLAVVSVGLMPIAVLRMLILVSAARQTVLAPEVAAKLVPVSLFDVLSGPFSKAATGALTTLNFFHLWSVLLIGIGFAAATRMKPWQALLISLVVYLLMAGAFGIGVPALMSGGGGHGGPGGRS